VPPPPAGVALLVLWGGGASCFYEGHIYFERNIGARFNIHFGRHFAWLKYFTYHSEPVLAPNYKQHILEPAKFRKIRYSLAELCHICLF
jgi:hypothetical protein